MTEKNAITHTTGTGIKPGHGTVGTTGGVPPQFPPRRALRRVVEYGRALEGRSWRWDVIPRPWANTDVTTIYMRPSPDVEPGWWGECNRDEDGAEPFWQVWT